MSTRRIIVERPIADEFSQRLAEKTQTLKVGDPQEHDTIIGPLINERALETGVARASTTPSRRARRCSPAARPTARRTSATLLTDVPADSDFATVRRRSGRSSAIEVVDSAGRGGRACERDELRAHRPGSSRATPTAASRSRDASSAGIVHVNDQTVGDEPQMPFGGVKEQRLRALRRHRGDRRVHGAPLDHRAEPDASVPVLAHGRDRPAQRGDRRARARRRHRRARGVHASDPARRGPRDRPPRHGAT